MELRFKWCGKEIEHSTAYVSCYEVLLNAYTKPAKPQQQFKYSNMI